MPLTAGRITSRMMRACIAGVTIGAGEYAPMPPVFGPASPSRRRLWSCDDASASTWRPSTITMKLASSPARKSSMTTRAPAAPIVLPTSIASTAASASSRVVATTTPLPAASPSALTTIGAPRSAMYACAACASVKVLYCAVGRPWRAMNAFAKSFELSSCAAACVGPKMRRPAARNASTMPAASGASGPTTVRPTCSRRAKATRSAIAVTATFTSAGSRAVPALPGATNTRATRGLCAIFHASACSRPPPPIDEDVQRIGLVPEVPDAGEDHRDAALVRGGDDLVVAHAAARLDHRGGAVVGDDVEAVAEREERIGRDDRSRERRARRSRP